MIQIIYMYTKKAPNLTHGYKSEKYVLEQTDGPLQNYIHLPSVGDSNSFDVLMYRTIGESKINTITSL